MEFVLKICNTKVAMYSVANIHHIKVTVHNSVLSDYPHHNANVVHVFVSHMLQSLKILLPQVSHVHYFSDGAPFQYKNFKNLTNLIHHQGDHQLSAEWHFLLQVMVKALVMVQEAQLGLVTHSSFQNNHILNVDFNV